MNEYFVHKTNPLHQSSAVISIGRVLPVEGPRFAPTAVRRVHIVSAVIFISTWLLALPAQTAAGNQWSVSIDWWWHESTSAPSSLHVVSTPAIAPLSDCASFIVFATSSDSTGNDLQPGVLRAIDGETGSELFTAMTTLINATSPPAVGDLDGDGGLEIIAVKAGGGSLVAFDDRGALLWTSAPIEQIVVGGPSIADLDGDGIAEIVVGRQVVGATGTVHWTGTGTRGAWYPGAAHSIAVNLDGTPGLEVVAGPTVYRSDGTTLWHNANVADGFPAVADFDSDGLPEVLVVGQSSVSLLKGSDGAVLWSNPSSLGGPPAIADADRDGVPDIVVAHKNAAAQYGPDGKLRWTVPTIDTSGLCGTAAFDFDGDGAFEFIYRDHDSVYVRSGDGSLLVEMPISSCTWTDFPVIADIDADGIAEVVAAANPNCGFGTATGLYAYQVFPPGRVSAGCRQIWNQATYHVDNVADDGTIPVAEAATWTSHNTFRAALPMTATNADINGDGSVNGADLGALLGSWGPCSCCLEDLNHDGFVDGADIGILLGAWTG